MQSIILNFKLIYQPIKLICFPFQTVNVAYYVFSIKRKAIANKNIKLIKEVKKLC